MGTNTKVNFTFMYHTEKDLEKLSKHLYRHNIFFAFVYLHELQHILRRHTTSVYDRMMQNIAHGIVNPHYAINVAEDHAINYSLKDLFTESTIKYGWADIERVICYKARYHEAQMSDISILKDMKGNAITITSKQVSDLLNKVTCDGQESLQPIEQKSQDGTEKDKCGTAGDNLDNALADLAESLQDIIKSNTKGSKAGELFADLFASIKVETGWFKKIKASFKRQVYYKTHDYTTSWANLNSTFRHIYKSPKKQFMDTKINIILSIDHSGSMSTQELQKLLYLIESESTRIDTLTVLIHDMRIIHEFTIADEYDIAQCPEFKKALATRYASGGTSHDCVFKEIETMKQDKIKLTDSKGRLLDIEDIKVPKICKENNTWDMDTFSEPDEGVSCFFKPSTTYVQNPRNPRAAEKIEYDRYFCDKKRFEDENEWLSLYGLEDEDCVKCN